MNKVIIININALVFHVDEVAYGRLKTYLDSLYSHFKNTEGKEEILGDIEARIAELLSERTKGRKEVVSDEDVDAVLEVLGTVADMDDADPTAGETAASSSDTYESGRRRLYRDVDNKMVGGVCSGIAAYFDIDVTWVRLILVLIVFFGLGSPFLLYIILWIVVPPALTPSDKLEMRGEKVNISNIEKRVKSEMGDIKGKVSEWGNEVKEFGSAGNRQRMASNISQAGGEILRVFVKIVGFFFVFIGISAVIGIIFGLLGTLGVVGDGIPFIVPDVFDGSPQLLIAGIAASLIFGIPFIGLLYVGIKLLLGIRHKSKWIPAILLSLWIVGIGLGVMTGINTGRKFTSENTLTKDIPLTGLHDTLVLDVSGDYISERHYGRRGFKVSIDNSTHTITGVNIEIGQSGDSSFHLRQKITSRGSDVSEAAALAEGVNYDFKLSGKTLLLDQQFSLSKGTHWRMQEVNLELQVPKGKVISFSEEINKIGSYIYPIVGDFDHDKRGKMFLSTENGFLCLNCVHNE